MAPAFFILLSQVYLKKCDYVVNSERRIKKAGAIRKNETQLMKPNINLTPHVAPQPEEIEDIPVGIMIKKPNFWTFSGDSKLQFLQNYISDNWYKGGESNYSMVGNVSSFEFLNPNFISSLFSHLNLLLLL